VQALDPKGIYSDQAVKDALAFKRGSRNLSFRYDLLDSANNLVAPLTSVIGGHVANSSLADIKRTATFTLLDDGAVNFLNQRIKPWVRLAMPDGGVVEWPQGVFLLSTPKRTMTSGMYVTRDVQAYDQLQVLSDDKASTRYTVTAGTKYTDAVLAIVNAEGMQVNVTPSALTLPAALEWGPGTSYLRIVNDLLGAINYESATFDQNGVFIAKPYVSPASRPATFTYATDRTSVIGGDIDQTLDLFDVPNKWVLVVSEADQASLRSEYTNTAPSSPTSTVSRGRTILEFRTGVTAANQATLDALTQRAAFDASQVFEVVEYKTALMPFHGDSDVFNISMARLGIASPYSETHWEFDLAVGAMMTHSVRRIVNV
jgi:hypothetical protein